jgi:hypothetical protein
MSDKSTRVTALVREAIAAVEEELHEDDCDDYFGIHVVRQLLQETLNTLETGHLPDRESRDKGIGRIVLDGWPPTSHLSNLVVKAELAYFAL